uniref:Pecanex-like protein n=1 Tax=Loa loa TaxID=7209 RepID=A0A1I7W373_LOALO
RNMLKSTTLEDKSVTGDEFTTDNEVAIVKKSQSNSMSPSNVRRLPVGITHNSRKKSPVSDATINTEDVTGSKQSGKEAKSQDEKTSDNRTNNLSLDTSSMYGITDTVWKIVLFGIFFFTRMLMT